LPYCNNFETVWECASAIEDQSIDWRSVIDTQCPICHLENCWREITPYRRLVIELFPFREETIAVPRFLCRNTGRTFSLLPHFLAPYHQYTVASMLFALLLAAACRPDGILSLFAAAEKLIAEDSRVTGFLLGTWLVLCVTGLRRERAELARWADLSSCQSAKSKSGFLTELNEVCLALGVRGPCGEGELPSQRGLNQVLERHARTTRRFLFGVPSQDRSGRRPS
jgi:hypothetical protein